LFDSRNDEYSCFLAIKSYNISNDQNSTDGVCMMCYTWLSGSFDATPLEFSASKGM